MSRSYTRLAIQIALIIAGYYLLPLSCCGRWSRS
jgi:hypothetical protein